jgi:hypothetical protein
VIDRLLERKKERNKQTNKQRRNERERGRVKESGRWELEDWKKERRRKTEKVE